MAERTAQNGTYVQSGSTDKHCFEARRHGHRLWTRWRASILQTSQYFQLILAGDYGMQVATSRR